MELETRNEFDDNTIHNIFFYATMCHVCKRFGKHVHLKRCGGCSMIAYCGKEHQKRHWTQHKSLCKVIQDVLREYTMDSRDVTSEEFDKMKMNFMLLVSLKLKRRLKTYEVEMFQFPKECIVCHERNGQLLEDCQKCAVSFCKTHKNYIKHTDMCAPLELCLRLNLLCIRRFINYEESISRDLHYLQHISDTATFRDMNDFIKTYGNFLFCKNDGTFSEYDVKVAKHSNYLTRPLTLFHAMRLLNYVPEREGLVIHVIGASSNEVVTLIVWEVLLHLIRTLSSLVIIMIGPELTVKSYPLYLCNNCMSREKNISLQFHNVLYEDYVNNSFVKPDIVIGFNVGFHAAELNSTAETWARSIQALAKQDCPFVFTCYTRQELEDDIDRINIVLDRKVDCLYSGKNPFAGLRPYRMMGRENVFYWNNSIAVYRSLCS